MENYERISALATKKGRYTAKEREFIVALAAENGIFVNTLCSSCYKDAAIELAVMLKPKESTNVGGYVLRAGTDLILHGRNGNKYRVCAATLTEENAQEWLANGLDRSAFEQLPE